MTDRTISKKQATQAARDFISSVTGPDRQWSLSLAEACLPRGVVLADHATEDQFHPLTVRNAADAFYALARRAA